MKANNNKKEAEIQHQKGKLSARERINLLVDEDSFVEVDSLVETRFSKFGMDKKKVSGDAVICGWAKIKGRQMSSLFYQYFTTYFQS